VTAEFTIGDKAVYPSQGVAEVVGIEKKEVYGKIQNFYVLRGLDTGLRILSLFEVAEVFRDLYRLKGLKPLSFGERRMLDTAKGLIVQELSVARAADTQKVEKELEQLFG
jgi:CarD family transcriptional regulator